MRVFCAEEPMKETTLQPTVIADVSIASMPVFQEVFLGRLPRHQGHKMEMMPSGSRIAHATA